MTVTHLVPSTVDQDQLGRYRLVAQLGQGGMGTIHLAVTSGLGEFRKLLVVKELQRDLAQNEKFVEMFMSEAKLAARLNHPNIVQTIEAGEEDGRYFLSMEFLDGQPLTALLKRASIDPVVSLGVRLSILCEVLAGLHYAHELCDFDGTPYQIVHRDVTPHNVFVTYHGQVKLVDFGIAKAVDVESLTSAGVFKGKFAYAAPEQVRGDAVDRRGDIFAVGVMLWEVIAMKRFAAGAPTKSMVERRLNGSEPRIAEAMPSVDPLLAEICDRAMHHDPEARYATAEQLRLDLQKYVLISGETPSTPLGDLMQAKFAAERAAMSRLIDAQVKREDRSQSLVRVSSLNLPAPPASEATSPQHGLHARASAADKLAERTVVGDLEPYIEASRVDNPVGVLAPKRLEEPLEWPSELRGRSRAWPWLTAAAAFAVGLALWLWNGESPRPVPPPAASAAQEPPPSPLQPAPREPVLEPEPASPPSAAPVPEPTPRAASTPERLSPAASSQAAAEPKPWRANRQPASDEDVLPRTPAAAAPRQHSPLSSPADVGTDLRALPKRTQRPIDVEDPFQ